MCSDAEEVCSRWQWWMIQPLFLGITRVIQAKTFLYDDSPTTTASSSRGVLSARNGQCPIKFSRSRSFKCYLYNLCWFSFGSWRWLPKILALLQRRLMMRRFGRMLLHMRGYPLMQIGFCEFPSVNFQVRWFREFLYNNRRGHVGQGRKRVVYDLPCLKSQVCYLVHKESQVIWVTCRCLIFCRGLESTIESRSWLLTEALWYWAGYPFFFWKHLFDFWKPGKGIHSELYTT